MKWHAASPGPDSPTGRSDDSARRGVMNAGVRVIGRHRRAWPMAKTGAVVIATAGMAVLPVACSGSTAPGGSPDAGGSASSQSGVGYSQCMRSHGVPDFPDPTSSGGIPKGSALEFGVSSTQFSAAERACQHLLPATGGSLIASSLRQCYLAGVCPQGLVQQALDAGRLFAECMRSRGVANWPDPSVDSQGRPLFNIQVPSPAPPRVSTAISECSRLEHAGSLLAWGSRHSSMASGGKDGAGS